MSHRNNRRSKSRSKSRSRSRSRNSNPNSDVRHSSYQQSQTPKKQYKRKQGGKKWKAKKQSIRLEDYVCLRKQIEAAGTVRKLSKKGAALIEFKNKKWGWFNANKLSLITDDRYNELSNDFVIDKALPSPSPSPALSDVSHLSLNINEMDDIGDINDNINDNINDSSNLDQNDENETKNETKTDTTSEPVLEDTTEDRGRASSIYEAMAADTLNALVEDEKNEDATPVVNENENENDISLQTTEAAETTENIENTANTANTADDALTTTVTEEPNANINTKTETTDVKESVSNVDSTDTADITDTTDAKEGTNMTDSNDGDSKNDIENKNGNENENESKKSENNTVKIVPKSGKNGSIGTTEGSSNNKSSKNGKQNVGHKRKISLKSKLSKKKDEDIGNNNGKMSENRLKFDESERQRREFERKMKLHYKVTDARERAFLVMADESKLIYKKMFINYFQHFALNTEKSKELRDNNIKCSKEEFGKFFEFMSDNKDTLSFSKFVKCIDDNGDVIHAFALWKITGDSREARGRGHSFLVEK